MIGWLAGLIDGEGCFTLDISKRSKTRLTINFRFQIAMSAGEWEPIIERIFTENKIQYKKRTHNYLTEIDMRRDNVIKLCKLIIQHSIIKKPIIERFLVQKPRSPRNRFTQANLEEYYQIADFVDWIREFNRKRNVPYVWDGKAILRFYGIPDNRPREHRQRKAASLQSS
jgi:hypothetical protein